MLDYKACLSMESFCIGHIAPRFLRDIHRDVHRRVRWGRRDFFKLYLPQRSQRTQRIFFQWDCIVFYFKLVRLAHPATAGYNFRDGWLADLRNQFASTNYIALCAVPFALRPMLFAPCPIFATTIINRQSLHALCALCALCGENQKILPRRSPSSQRLFF